MKGHSFYDVRLEILCGAGETDGPFVDNCFPLMTPCCTGSISRK